MKKSKTEKFNIAKNMPPLFHRLPGEEFDFEKSEVVQWLIQQSDILSYVWDKVKSSGNVVYDKNTGLWQGIDYEGEQE